MQRDRWMIDRLLPAVVVLAVATFLAGSDGQSPPKAAPASPVASAAYLDPRSVDLTRLLPPPPANDSVTTRSELDELLQIQSSRTSEDCDRAVADREVKLLRFAGALGLPPSVEAHDLPKTTALIEQVRRIESSVVDRAKRAYGRPRPFVLDPRIEPCIIRPGNDAYPSGHSAWAYVAALVLADMVPERRQQLLDRAADYARQRMVGGVHYRSDTEAGRITGVVLAAMLFASPAFQADEALARSELRGALGLPQQP
jgi:acid phosphatase (class A)